MGSNDLPGILIAFEGIDGSGKTTQAALLKHWAEALGFEVLSEKEPTAGRWGAKIRSSKFSARMPAQEEFECFVQDRREHVTEVIRPALERGALVIIDRYYYSTVAYQGARGLDPSMVLAVNRSFAPVPNLVALLDLDPAVGLGRVQKRGEGQDLFESLDELTRARAIFLGLREPHIVTIDATQTKEQVHGRVIFELARGPMFERLSKLGSQLVAPPGDVDLELLKAAQTLAEDSSLSPEEKIRLLRERAKKKLDS